MCAAHISVAQHSIVGNLQLCIDECQTYTVDNGLGGPYYWITTGQIQGVNVGEQIEICWTDAGSNDLEVIDFAANMVDQSAQVSVTVESLPIPEIIFPLYPTCVVRDSLDDPTGGNEDEFVNTCRSVCSGSTVTYYSNVVAGQTAIWEVDGGSVITQSPEEITVEWSTSGGGLLTLIIISDQGCSAEISYCIDILDPIFVDIVAFSGGPSDISVCLGQEVYLQSVVSQDVTQLEWVFDHGPVQIGSSTSISFDQPGSYGVTLIGRTECGCETSSDYTINVDSNPGPEIMCTGTTCPGTEETYEAIAGCSNYSWSISNNGTITDGGGPADHYVSVEWGAGPIGEVSLSVTGCGTPFCATETTVQIPIISSSAPIIGPAVVCKRGYSTYSIQNFNGADYNWNISGNGSIVEGHGTHSIVVKWSDRGYDPDQAQLTVNYDNCYLECGGTALLDIDLKSEFLVTGNRIACDNGQVYFNVFEGFNSATVDIEITSPSGVVSTYPLVSNINESFTELGRYKVVATDGAGLYCNQEEVTYFEIVAAPSAPSHIQGPTAICLHEYYTYQVPNVSSDTDVRWAIRDGNNFQNVTGSQVNIEWKTTGPYTIEVYYYRSDIFCSSDRVSLDIQRIQNATLSGADIVCRDEVVTYSAGVGAELSGTWEVIPQSAGSISINPDNTVDIAWHLEGNHKIEAGFCGATISYDVQVLTNQLGTASFDDVVCPGERSELTVAMSTAGTVEVVDELDQVVSLTTPVMLDPGQYLATITSSFGCQQVIPVVIDSTLGPQVRVSSPEGNAYCLPHPLIDIYALDADEGYTFEWFKDGVALGMTGSKISVNDYGAYSVIATDQNGCTFESNEHILYEWCTGDQPPGTCSNSGGPSLFEYFEVGCNNGNFALKSIGYASTIWEWTFSDPDSGTDNFAVGTNPSHTFTNAGFFYVFLDGNAPGEDAVEIITIPAAPRFDYLPGCVGGPIAFANHSTFIPGYTNIFGYAWDFGDPTSGADNTSTDVNPTHTYSVPGTYTVVLDITGDNGCIASYQLEVEVSDGPIADFVVPSSSCSDQGLPFISIPSDDIISYAWDFGDVASGSANTSAATATVHEFASTGVYNVTLTVEDIRGCQSSITKPITVVASSLSGEITADKGLPICVGEQLTLSAPAGGAQYFWSTGETTHSITVEDPGLYYVTVSDVGGCTYEPSPISVRVDGLVNRHLTGIVYESDSDFNGLRFLDSMEICQGDRMAMIATYVFQGGYDWSIGTSVNSYNEAYEFRQLTAGRYDITLKITDSNSGCVIDMEPFTLKINPIPDVPVIAQQGQNLCADTPNLLNISNPDPTLTYYWSTGEIGTSITARSGGYYKVQALNRSGCESPETGIFIADIPDANRINLGCMMACFPDTICIPSISGASTYQWLRDGLPVPGGNIQDLITQEAGDFQLIVANYYGCADTSDVLSIDAEASDQSLSGLVFIDDNANGIWDSGEELLSGVPVHMYDGGSISATAYTDALGNYLFDPVTVINPQMVIDTAGLGLNLTGGTFDAMIQYQTCVEDKLQDFPLLRNCSPVDMPLQLYICEGQTTTVNNIVLAAGDDWIFVDLGTNGCDSTTFVEVLPFPSVEIAVTELSACPDIDNGSIDITILDGTNPLFAIDVASGFSNDLSYSGLAVGVHTLYILDGNACPTSQSFEIIVSPTPSLTLDVEPTCYGGTNGELSVSNVTSSSSYQYSLDGITFDLQSQWSDLPSGAGVLYISDVQGCTFEEPYLILENDEPMMSLTTTNTCTGYSEGTVLVESSSAGNYEFSMDGLTYGTNNTFDGLSEGAHTIYVREDGHCLSTMALVIDANPDPIVTALIDQPCAGGSNGGVTLDGNGEVLSYSLDGIDFDADPNFEGLSAGVYTFYVKGQDLCVHPIEVEVDEATEMDVIFEEPVVDCNMDQVLLMPEVVDPVGEVRFIWSDGSDAESLIAIADGDITVTVEDDCSSYSNTYTVDIQEVIDEQPIYFPNVFSPNNDGANECFVPSLNPQTQIISYELMVFDRWGNKLFETTDFNECWDGYFQKQRVRTGVFVYLMNLEYTFCTEVKNLEVAGDVTIVD